MKSWNKTKINVGLPAGRATPRITAPRSRFGLVLLVAVSKNTASDADRLTDLDDSYAPGGRPKPAVSRIG